MHTLGTPKVGSHTPLHSGTPPGLRRSRETEKRTGQWVTTLRACVQATPSNPRRLTKTLPHDSSQLPPLPLLGRSTAPPTQAPIPTTVTHTTRPASKFCAIWTTARAPSP